WQVWNQWDVPYALDADHMISGLGSPGPALLTCLRADTVLYGLLWITVDPKNLPTEKIQQMVALAQVLADRLHDLQTSFRWDEILANINAFIRELAQAGRDEEIWELVHAEIKNLFDVTSFYVGLVNAATHQIALPLVSERGMLIYYGSI